MQLTPRSIMLFAALTFGSLALGAVTAVRVSAMPAASHAFQALTVGSGDPSVPPASSVNFPAEEGTDAPTF